MKYPVIIGYVLISMAVVYFCTKPSFKVVSECCKDSYREVLRADIPTGPNYLCLNCKKWCDLVEIKEID